MSSPPRFLLLQARNPGDPGKDHEQQCFAETLGVPPHSLRYWDLLEGPPQQHDLAEVDLLLVGGSGDYSVLDNLPFVHQFIDFLSDTLVPQNLPTFASCFGFQALVMAAGGQLVRDPAQAEVGTFDISVTDAGRDDPLLGSLFPSFKAQLGHKDRVEQIPAGLTSLAASERAPCQALHVTGTSIYGTQFHPELTRESNIYRFNLYRERYEGSAAEDSASVLDSLEDTPGASALLPRWVEMVENSC
jgi:GMP synthase (glutamine-hydrolysing)